MSDPQERTEDMPEELDIWHRWIMLDVSHLLVIYQSDRGLAGLLVDRQYEISTYTGCSRDGMVADARAVSGNNKLRIFDIPKYGEVQSMAYTWAKSFVEYAKEKGVI